MAEINKILKEENICNPRIGIKQHSNSTTKKKKKKDKFYIKLKISIHPNKVKR